MREPLLAPTAAVAAGVLAARFASLSFLEAVLAAAVCAVAALVGVRLPRLRCGTAACLLGLFFVGAALHSSQPPPAADRIDFVIPEDAHESPVRLTGWVSRPPEDRFDGDRFVLEAETILNGVPVSGAVQVTAARPPEDPPLDLRYGDRIELIATLRRPRNYQNPGAFDYVGYLARQGIYLTANTRPYAPLLPLEGPAGSQLEALLWRARASVRQRFESVRSAAGLDGRQSAAVLEASLLGERKALSPQTELDFQRAGAYHALVVSGLHVGVLAGAALWLLRRFGLPWEVAAVLGLLLAAAYALLLDTPLPAVRAASMLAAWTGAALVYRGRRALNAIAAVALCFLAVNPAALLEPGFQLSFGAVAAIAGIATPLLDRWTGPRLRALRDIENVEIDLNVSPDIADRRVAARLLLESLAARTHLPPRHVAAVLRFFWIAVATVIVSSVLLIALAAPMAWHFQRISGASPAANLLVLPLISALVPVGFLALASGWTPLFQLAATLADAMIWAAELGAAGFFSGVPLDRRTPPPPEWLAGAALASLLLWAVLLARRARGRRLAALAALVPFALIVTHPFPADLPADRLELTAIDVGQGDALLLSAPPGEAVLIDAGGIPSFDDDGPPPLDIGEAVVAPYLWSRSIQRLRALAVTHADADHAGGAAAILEAFTVGELWIPTGAQSPLFDELRLIAAARRVTVRELSAGDRLPLGDLFLDVLAPSPLLPDADSNDRSLALAADFGDRRFLLTGDLEADGEHALAPYLDAHAGGVLKVGHHGSRTSSRPALIDAFPPAIAVVSAGYRNLYTHPHQETLERLEAVHARVLRTDQSGCVRVSTDGRRYFVSTFAFERALQAPARLASMRRYAVSRNATPTR